MITVKGLVAHFYFPNNMWYAVFTVGMLKL